MPLTKFDDRAALVLIDLQKGIARLPTVHPPSEIIARAVRLADAFRQRNLPVVLVNVTGVAPGRVDRERPKLVFTPEWSELVPELRPQPTDHLISKQHVGAFIGTALQEVLHKEGVTQIFFAGISTSAGVESTARGAYDYGYNVVFVTDAMTDRDAEAHRLSIEKIFPGIGELDTTDNVLKFLR